MSERAKGRRSLARWKAGYVKGSARAKDRILWNSGRKEVDEIVAFDVTVHMEQMTERCWWMGITSADGKNQLTVNFEVIPGKRKAMTVTCEDDGPEPWPWAQDEEH